MHPTVEAPDARRQPSRRALVGTVAWSAPTLVVSAAAPAIASSAPINVGTGISYSPAVIKPGEETTFTAMFANDGAEPYENLKISLDFATLSLHTGGPGTTGYAFNLVPGSATTHAANLPTVSVNGGPPQAFDTWSRSAFTFAKDSTSSHLDFFFPQPLGPSEQIMLTWKNLPAPENANDLSPGFLEDNYSAHLHTTSHISYTKNGQTAVADGAASLDVQYNPRLTMKPIAGSSSDWSINPETDQAFSDWALKNVGDVRLGGEASTFTLTVDKLTVLALYEASGQTPTWASATVNAGVATITMNPNLAPGETTFLRLGATFQDVPAAELPWSTTGTLTSDGRINSAAPQRFTVHESTTSPGGDGGDTDAPKATLTDVTSDPPLAQLNPGDTATISLVVTNTGTTQHAFDVAFDSTGLAYILSSATVDGNQVADPAGNVFTLDVAPGASATLTFRVRATPGSTPPMTITVSSNGSAPLASATVN